MIAREARNIGMGLLAIVAVCLLVTGVFGVLGGILWLWFHVEIFRWTVAGIAFLTLARWVGSIYFLEEGTMRYEPK